MDIRRLGAHGPAVSALGLGCMSFAGFYGPTDEAQSHRCLAAAMDLGITHLDTAELYGQGLSEQVIGRFLKTRPHAFRLASKAGIITQPRRRFDNTPDYLRRTLESSLRRLGTDHIDLYYIHRHDETIPIEEVTGTMARFVAEGKIGGMGFSEIAPATLRRAHAVHPVRAVQSEYSLWTRMPELGMIQTTAELGVAFVAFSPLGRGMFTDRTPDPAGFAPSDFRRDTPRFQPPNFAANCAAIAGFRDFARSRGWSTAATAIAWVLDQAPHILPIPGTRSAEHLRACAMATAIRFSAEDRAEIARLLPVGFAHGARYSLAQQRGTAVYG